MQNAEIARLLTDVADLLEISAGNPFKVRAYRNAARTVADHSDPIAELVAGGEFDLTELPGIGGGIAKEITALVRTGTLPQRQQLVATIPPGLLDRRRKETIGDLDIVVSCTNPSAVIARFGKFGEVTHVASQGDTRSTVRLSSGLQVDLRVVEPAAFGAAMQYFTGSQAHNIELRKIAQAKQLK